MKISIEQIKTAIKAGYSCYIIVNGETYELDFSGNEKAKSIIEYLESHNKNYTKKQYYNILELKEIITGGIL